MTGNLFNCRQNYFREYAKTVKLPEASDEKFDLNKLTERKVNIKICLGRGRHMTGPYKEWKTRTYDDTDKVRNTTVENKGKNNFSHGFSILIETLEQSDIDPETLKKHIDISDIKIFDKTQKLDIQQMSRVLEWLKGFDVVHIQARFMSEETKEKIVISTHALRQTSVVLSPCAATRLPPAPVDFPGHMVISVGSEFSKDQENKDEDEFSVENNEDNIPLIGMNNFQSCGSALDFVCSDELLLKKDPWEASYYATAVAILVLLKAYALGK